ncbi:hypothetical protein [Arthrospiribacter ruber]|uniref:hypothetical protein n=1 Tax=Arthrospiribacter ruber TaxID=2487934 RepID=UPI001C5BA48B|nr:hypothetical protein [Arthrospiribacter ruber]
MVELIRHTGPGQEDVGKNNPVQGIQPFPRYSKPQNLLLHPSSFILHTWYY